MKKTFMDKNELRSIKKNFNFFDHERQVKIILKIK